VSVLLHPLGEQPGRRWLTRDHPFGADDAYKKADGLHPVPSLLDLPTLGELDGTEVNESTGHNQIGTTPTAGQLATELRQRGAGAGAGAGGPAGQLKQRQKEGLAAELVGRKAEQDSKFMAKAGEGVDTVKRDADVLTKFIVCKFLKARSPPDFGRTGWKGAGLTARWLLGRLGDWLPRDHQRARFLCLGRLECLKGESGAGARLPDCNAGCARVPKGFRKLGLLLPCSARVGSKAHSPVTTTSHLHYASSKSWRSHGPRRCTSVESRQKRGSANWGRSARAEVARTREPPRDEELREGTSYGEEGVGVVRDLLEGREPLDLEAGRDGRLVGGRGDGRLAGVDGRERGDLLVALGRGERRGGGGRGGGKPARGCTARLLVQ